MAAPVSTKSARERLEKSTPDFDRTDGSTDDGGAAEVAEGHFFMVDGGWCLVFALGGCYDCRKGRCRLDARCHGFNHSPCTAIPLFQASRVESRAFYNVPPCPDEARIAMHHVLGPTERRQMCNSEVAIQLKCWAGGLIRDRHQDRRELQTVLYL
jgi:hypothetical protein